ncbi:hypothetical protein BLA17378_01681 [Burkholderia aenigmatica]|uniref:Uncharacterized protein n=1 Tax=Burkholderia aenigmatica TaxID=2015348 RepID=A0ABY6XR88_9BURK|nr:hypothetical protein BLA17378_01681 [Burkholderia aenigmatica]VWC80790.1 hypothetical protein BLA18628_01187 [Burkholderia aenigmatica]
MRSGRREEAQPSKEKVADRYPSYPDPEAYWVSVIL